MYGKVYVGHPTDSKKMASCTMTVMNDKDQYETRPLTDAISIFDMEKVKYEVLQEEKWKKDIIEYIAEI